MNSLIRTTFSDMLQPISSWRRRQQTSHPAGCLDQSRNNPRGTTLPIGRHEMSLGLRTQTEWKKIDTIQETRVAKAVLQTRLLTCPPRLGSLCVNLLCWFFAGEPKLTPLAECFSWLPINITMAVTELLPRDSLSFFLSVFLFLSSLCLHVLL